MDMVAHAEINNLSFVYADEHEKRCSIFLFLFKKESLLHLLEDQGSGKTTLLKHFKKELLPIGKRTGDTYYDGTLLENVPDLLSAQEIGMVFQNPENQLVMDTVIQELAFSLENIGLPSHIIQNE